MRDFLVNAFKYNANDKAFMNPTGLKNIIRKKFFPTMQHDSHEFLMHVLSCLQDQETPKKYKKFDGDVTESNKHRTISDIYDEYFQANPSVIDSLFTGIQRSIVTCAKSGCKHQSITYRPFSCLSI